MIETIIKAVVGFAVIAGGWLSVQLAWRKVFAHTITEQDAVPDRCGGFGCCHSNCDAESVEQERSASIQTNHKG